MGVVVRAFIDDVIKCVDVSLNENSGMFRPLHNVSLEWCVPWTTRHLVAIVPWTLSSDRCVPTLDRIKVLIVTSQLGLG